MKKEDRNEAIGIAVGLLLGLLALLFARCEHGGDTHIEGDAEYGHGEYTNPACIDDLGEGTVYSCVYYEGEYPECVEVTVGECRMIFCDRPACYVTGTISLVCGENTAGYLVGDDDFGWEAILPCD